MSFLRLNGFTVPVLNATAGRRIERKGGRKRSFRGEVHDSSRGARRTWSMTACFTGSGYDYEDALAFMRLVDGEGHVVTFGTGLQASTGLNPEPGYASVSWNSGNGQDGDPGFVSFAGATGVLQYDAQLGDEWTVAFIEDPATAVGAVYRSDGVGWLNGAVQSWSVGSYFTTAEPVVRDGVLTLTSPSAVDIDTLVLLPFLASSEMGEVWSTLPGGSPLWGPLPTHRMSGTIIGESFTHVVGRVEGFKYVGKGEQSGNVATRWVNNALLVDFTLMEVARTYVRADVL